MAEKGEFDDFLVPQFGRMSGEVLFGDLWEQPELSKRDRSLITVAVTMALYRTQEIKSHMKFAIVNGVTTEELKGVVTHIAFYAGWPCAANGQRVLQEVLDEAD